jgi:hypothetical protein
VQIVASVPILVLTVLIQKIGRFFWASFESELPSPQPADPLSQAGLCFSQWFLQSALDFVDVPFLVIFFQI